jgi:VIT1/CCC1 family predicted Fe2+/Mn2+ transporter
VVFHDSPPVPGAWQAPVLREPTVTIAATWQRLRTSLVNSAGTIVFGMEDGTVSIFGLIFGVAATTSSTAAVVIAGASGAVAAAVSMMAGVFLDVETTRDELRAKRSLLRAKRAANTNSIPTKLAAVGLTSEQSAALVGAVKHDHKALSGLLLALQGTPDTQLNPWEQALWMLLADFLAAAVPILPFVVLPIPEARVTSAVVTIALLAALGVGRARIANGSTIRGVVETVSIGVAAAVAGVAIGVLIDRAFTG